MNSNRDQGYSDRRNSPQSSYVARSDRADQPHGSGCCQGETGANRIHSIEQDSPITLSRPLPLTNENVSSIQN